MQGVIAVDLSNPMLDAVRMAPVLAVCGLCAWGAVSDLASFLIPDEVSIGILLAFAVKLAVIAALGSGPGQESLSWSMLGLHLACGFGVFVLTATLFFFDAFGGGDVKMLTAVAVWTPPAQLLSLLTLICLIGGGMAAVIVSTRRLIPERIWGEHQRLARLFSGKKGIPYGAAIALGVWILFLAIPAQSGILYIAEAFTDVLGLRG